MFGCQGSQLHPRSAGAAHVVRVREERGKREEIVRCCWRRRQLTFIPTSDRVLESCPELRRRHIRQLPSRHLSYICAAVQVWSG